MAAEAQCAAGLRLFLEHGHAVTFGDQRRIGQAGRTGADYRDAFSAGRLWRDEHCLSSSGAVDHAADAGAAAHLVDAGVAGKAAPDRLAAAHLLGPLRIGDQRAAERDEIGFALGDGALRRRRIAKTADRDNGNADAPLHLGRVIEKSRVGISHGRQDDLR